MSFKTKLPVDLFKLTMIGSSNNTMSWCPYI